MIEAFHGAEHGRPFSACLVLALHSSLQSHNEFRSLRLGACLPLKLFFKYPCGIQYECHTVVKEDHASIPSSFRSTELRRKRQNLRPTGLKNAMDFLNTHATSALPICKEHPFGLIPLPRASKIKPHGKINHGVGYAFHNWRVKELPVLAG